MLGERTFGQWEFIFDRDATVEAYSRSELGTSETCGCAGCMNFRLVRSHVFPASFFQLLDELGIDPRKDAEIFECGRLESGHHWYGGWFHFVGVLKRTGDFPKVEAERGFEVWMSSERALAWPAFEGQPVVQLEFSASRVPWILDEAPTE